MTNVIDNAIARVQNIVAAMTSVTFKSAPDYPTDNIEPFPCSICYIGGGQFMATNATIHHNFPMLNIEFHFSRVNLKQTYQQINAVALEFPKRIVADPTLDATVDTVIMTRDQPITYTVRPFQWSPPNVTPVITSQMLLFSIPIKTLQAPQTTST